MRDWKVNPLGVLASLKAEGVKTALEFVRDYRVPLLKLLAAAWGIVLLMTFSMIVTVRLALSLLR